MSNEDYEHRMREWEVRASERVAMAQAITGFATLSIRSLLLFNGGAILALLTFLGNLISKPSVEMQSGQIKLFECAMLWFAGGIAFGLLCSGFSYISQTIIFERNNKWGYKLRFVAVVFAIVSFVCFCSGSFKAINAIALL